MSENTIEAKKLRLNNPKEIISVRDATRSRAPKFPLPLPLLTPATQARISATSDHNFLMSPRLTNIPMIRITLECCKVYIIIFKQHNLNAF